jgi:hypothetical protein
MLTITLPSINGDKDREGGGSLGRQRWRGHEPEVNDDGVLPWVAPLLGLD